ncbi:calcium-binding protein [Pseudoprimorskyibacter insulae]|uniref:Leukotoxin n=1 Tax=Pseudoprimorskyibacter insulae TaxID=1695997 RepID=A0A2R8AQ86_9RHOB|nr:calcium-binding protein [Pseudoprimorskyibacter insulae]SPF78203.1 Leukotoxin [Pseudoprimorskyibacter insulae]
MTITPGSEFVLGSIPSILGSLGAYPVAATLKDGTVALVWAENNWFDGDQFGDTSLWGRILNADGTSKVEPFRIQSDETGAQGKAHVVALSDGGFMVSWVRAHLIDGGVDEDVFVRSFDATGAARGTEQTFASVDLEVPVNADPGTYNDHANNTLLGLSGGGAIVGWTHRGSDTTWARTVGNDGVTLGEPVQIFNTDHVSLQFAQLTNGDVVMLRYAGDRTGVHIRLSGPDISSAPAGVAGATGPVEVYNDPADGDAVITSQYVTALPGGGFAAVYKYDPDIRYDEAEYINVDRFDATGTLVTRSQIALGHDQITSPTFHVAGLSGDRVMVAWQEASAYKDIDLFAQIVNADGTLDNKVQIHDADTGIKYVGGLAVLDSGDVLAVFAEGSNQPIDGKIDLLHGRIFDISPAPADAPVSKTGTDGNDVLQGGSGNDNLNGAGGNDTIRGMDGSDTLIGGAGDDFIFGGSTADDIRDVVYGGDGNDSIDGGYGNDELRGDAGDDSIEGGYGVDTVIGGDGNDVLTGSAWSDQIFGGNGNDFINGGFGFDRVNGGAGADKFYHTNAAGHGSDWIQDYNAAEGDVLFFGGGAATKSQFLVQRASTASAGDAGVQEVFITHIPSGNLLWALVDGDAQTSLNVLAGGQTFDLLA